MLTSGLLSFKVTEDSFCCGEVLSMWVGIKATEQSYSIADIWLCPLRVHLLRLLVIITPQPSFAITVAIYRNHSYSLASPYFFLTAVLNLHCGGP